MPQNLQGIELFAPTIPQILLNLTVSLVCSFIISWVYRYTYRGPGYANSFVLSIMYISMIVTLVIMIIGNNLARAFGLVGALSIIRFRTAVKDTIDIVYIFLGLTIGMAAGVGYFQVAIVGTVVIALVLIFFTKVNIKFLQGEQFLLQIQYQGDDVTSVKNVMHDYCSKYELINVKSSAGEGPREFSYYINLKRNKDFLDFERELRSVKAVLTMNLFRDEEHI